VGPQLQKDRQGLTPIIVIPTPVPRLPAASGHKVIAGTGARDRIPNGTFVRLGEDFYIGFLYGDVPDESEFLRTARWVWLEIKSDNAEEMSRKIVESGLVRKL